MYAKSVFSSRFLHVLRAPPKNGIRFHCGSPCRPQKRCAFKPKATTNRALGWFGPGPLDPWISTPNKETGAQTGVKRLGVSGGDFRNLGFVLLTHHFRGEICDHGKIMRPPKARALGACVSAHVCCKGSPQVKYTCPYGGCCLKRAPTKPRHTCWSTRGVLLRSGVPIPSSMVSRGTCH